MKHEIEDEEFEEWLQLETSEENNDWVAQQATQGLPLVLPWKTKILRLGTCFQSSLVHEDPWLQENPFILSDLYMIPKVLQSEYGSTSSFHSVNTSRQSETSDHLSLGFGMGVGLPFLCSASAKGTYDEDVKKNDDANKSSIRSSARAATVQLQRNPRLSHQAMAKLKYDGGYEAFTETYGDYFVWGYRIGGDTGLMLSSSSFSNKKVESYGITATVEVLFVEVSKTWTKDIHSFSAGKSMRLLGYDTLTDQTWNVTTAENGIRALADRAEHIILRSQSVLERTLEALEKQNMADGDEISNEQCDFLTGNGLVVELVLLPMSALRDVARWTTERNVI
ncbi:hypothetical protein K461DRAFT_295497 [Myriangium duriaei CBS 260.36]|uniref:MACPF domain-containing protein n=1 Tax=Myriangium duriaei CBS 260.36 TaxID=1168546 RepID=A0A9P4IXG8_9PEZI|nr:hypothetical protein K461DRAFT_295497 [Myriangium duriaei CBS 260.36]